MPGVIRNWHEINQSCGASTDQIVVSLCNWRIDVATTGSQERDSDRHVSAGTWAPSIEVEFDVDESRIHELELQDMKSYALWVKR